MIRIRGDIHGEIDGLGFAIPDDSTYDDYLIICGDFGVLWQDNMTMKYDIEELNEKNVTVLFLDGNHENYDILNRYPVTEWHGGKVQFIAEHIIHLMRGQVYEIDGYKIFTMGGAECHDIQDGIVDPEEPFAIHKIRRLQARNANFRVKGLSWWPEELPTEKELQEGLDNLARHNNTVDVILSHCAPTSIQIAIKADDYPVNRLTEYLERLKNTITYKKWFFGHYHENKNVDDKHTLLYYGYVCLNDALKLQATKENL